MTNSRSDEPVRAYLDRDFERSVSTAVVRAVAAALDRAPSQIGPLDSVVDPDALETLFSPRTNGERRDRARVTFTFEGCEVTIHANGEIVVHRPDPA